MHSRRYVVALDARLPIHGGRISVHVRWVRCAGVVHWLYCAICPCWLYCTVSTCWLHCRVTCWLHCCVSSRLYCGISDWLHCAVRGGLLLHHCHWLIISTRFHGIAVACSTPVHCAIPCCHARIHGWSVWLYDGCPLGVVSPVCFYFRIISYINNIPIVVEFVHHWRCVPCRV